MPPTYHFFVFFFFNDTATTEIYTLSLHDALPICAGRGLGRQAGRDVGVADVVDLDLDLVLTAQDRKSTRLNSSHSQISYAVFCLKKKKKKKGQNGVYLHNRVCNNELYSRRHDGLA